MNEFYYVGIVQYENQAFGHPQIGLVKTCGGGYLSAGNLVKFHIGESERIGVVLTTSLLKEGGDDEAVLLANTEVYEVEAIYHESWAKAPEKEEETDGN